MLVAGKASKEIVKNGTLAKAGVGTTNGVWREGGMGRGSLSSAARNTVDKNIDDGDEDEEVNERESWAGVDVVGPQGMMLWVGQRC